MKTGTEFGIGEPCESQDSGPLPAERTKKLKLSLEARHYSGTVVLHCQGRIVFGTETRALSTTVSEILPLAGKMVVDLADIEAIDSAALGELVLLHMWAEASGCTLKFAGATRFVRHLFESTNVADVLDLHASVPEAIDMMVPEELYSA